MIKRLMGSLREFTLAAILSPLCMMGEVYMEVKIPGIIATIVEVLPQIIEGIITTLMEGLPLIIQAGIKRVVYSEKYRLEDGLELLKRANIEVLYVNPNEQLSLEP